MEQYLARGQQDRIQQCLAAIDGLTALLTRPPADMETLCVLSPQGSLGQLLEAVGAFRAITSGDEVCPELGLLEILARRRPRCSGPGWDAVHEVASLYRGVAGIMQDYERLRYWDVDAPSAVAEGVKAELDRLVVEELEPVWDAFLDGLDSKTLAQLQLAGFDDAERVLGVRIVRDGGLAADTDAIDNARTMQQGLPEAAPDYISARIQGIREGQSQATTDRLYQEAHSS
ncbi:hypothetical protein MN608_11154 [Microdochium nivale]|nr:hypothetical protein MN608_11154 [Microdochium nivale]